jgi:hypothetical protein
MTKGAGRAGKLRRVINARLEEMSFRSGAAVSAGAVVVGGTGIALGLMLTGGHAAAVTGTPSAHVTLRPALVPASASASAFASPMAAPTGTPSGSGPALSSDPKPTPGASLTPSATTTSPTPASSLTPHPIGTYGRYRKHPPGPQPTLNPPGWP